MSEQDKNKINANNEPAVEDTVDTPDYSKRFDIDAALNNNPELNSDMLEAKNRKIFLMSKLREHFEKEGVQNSSAKFLKNALSKEHQNYVGCEKAFNSFLEDPFVVKAKTENQEDLSMGVYSSDDIVKKMNGEELISTNSNKKNIEEVYSKEDLSPRQTKLRIRKDLDTIRNSYLKEEGVGVDSAKSYVRGNLDPSKTDYKLVEKALNKFYEDEYLLKVKDILPEVLVSSPFLKENIVEFKNKSSKKAKVVEEKSDVRLSDLKHDKKNSLFDPEELYVDFFQEKGLSTEVMHDFLRGDTINNEDYQKSVEAFTEYATMLQKENREFEPKFLQTLNESSLMYLNVSNSGGTNRNTFDDKIKQKELAFDTLDNMLLSRNISPEFLIDVLSIGFNLETTGDVRLDSKGVPTSDPLADTVKIKDGKYTAETESIIKDYMAQPHMTKLLVEKYKHLNKAGVIEGINYKNKKTKSIPFTEQFLEVNNEGYSLQDASKGMKNLIDDIPNMIVLNMEKDKNSKFSIVENNDNIFLNKLIVNKDQSYWENEFNKKIQTSDAFEVEDIADNFWKRAKRVVKGRGTDDYGDMFAKTVMFKTEDNKIHPLLNVSRALKKVTVERMPENDNTYELMAMAAKMKGIKKPCINCFETDPEKRKEFVFKSLKHLIETTGYDIDNITVPNGMEDIKSAYLKAKNSITEAVDTPPPETEDQPQGENPTHEGNWNKQKTEPKSESMEVLSRTNPEGDAINQEQKTDQNLQSDQLSQDTQHMENMQSAREDLEEYNNDVYADSPENLVNGAGMGDSGTVNNPKTEKEDITAEISSFINDFSDVFSENNLKKNALLTGVYANLSKDFIIKESMLNYSEAMSDVIRDNLENARSIDINPDTAKTLVAIKMVEIGKELMKIEGLSLEAKELVADIHSELPDFIANSAQSVGRVQKALIQVEKEGKLDRSLISPEIVDPQSVDSQFAFVPKTEEEKLKGVDMKNIDFSKKEKVKNKKKVTPK